MTQQQVFFRFERQESPGAPAARLVVHTADADAEPISPRLFGNFLEHLGFSVQGGIQAQLLLNPTFAGAHHVPPGDLALLRENGAIAERIHVLDEGGRNAWRDWRPHLRVTGFGLMVLDDETQWGIPLPWKVEPARAGGTGKQPGRIGQSVRLNPAGTEIALAQGIFPPHQRVLSYTGHLWVKAIGHGELRVGLRRRSPLGEPTLLSVAQLPWPGERWQKLPLTLALPPNTLRPLEPVDFCILVSGEGSLWIDQAHLLPADHVEGFDPDMLEQVRWLAPPVLRGPGGNFTSTYHFWEGIGDPDLRQTSPNPDWGGIDDNSFGTLEFLRLCELVDTEPHLCVNQGNGTPEEAAAWVEYVNGSPDTHWGGKRAAHGRPEPFDVKLWEVGNEIYGPWQTGHCGPEENARRYRIWANAMLAVDPTLELLATGSCFDFVEPHHHWHEILLTEGGEHVQCIALHALPNNFQQIDEHMDIDELWRALMAHTQRWEMVDLPDLKEKIDRLAPRSEGSRFIDTAITEWGILGRTDRPQVGNLGGAIYAGLFLNTAIRQQEFIRIANATALFHGGCIRKAGPFIYHDPQVEVIRRYTGMAHGKRIPVTYHGPGYDVEDGTRTVPQIADVPYVDAVAVLHTDGALEIAIVNRNPTQPLALTLDLKDIHDRRLVAHHLLHGHLREMNTPLAPNRVTIQSQPLPSDGNSITLNLPPRSISWLRYE